jgi:hypothetical protein
LPYLTDIQEKVIVSYTNSLSIANVQNVTDGDSTWVASGDSLDVSKPLRLKVFAIDESKTKFYDVWVNIHQVDPDSIQYKPLALSGPFEGDVIMENQAIRFENSYYLFEKTSTPLIYPGLLSLYKSTDMKNWEVVTLTGLPFDTDIKNIQTTESSLVAHNTFGDFYISYDAFTWNKINTKYPVKSILGFLNEKLSLIVENGNGELIFAFTDLLEWEDGSKIPDNFPLSGFSTINSQSSTIEKITLVGGKSSSGEVLNTVWSTQNGVYWAKLNDQKKSPIIEGGNAFLYDNEIYWLSGSLHEADGNVSYNKNVYSSIDGGVTWKIKPDKYSPPENYPFLQNTSVVTDPSGTYFYIVGGQNGNVPTNVWEAFINRKTFAGNSQ